MDRGAFLIADGRRVEMDIGGAWATINGTSEVTLAVFGEDDAPALLGAYTLEGLRLAVDPVCRPTAGSHTPNPILGPAQSRWQRASQPFHNRSPRTADMWRRCEGMHANDPIDASYPGLSRRASASDWRNSWS